MSTRPVVLAAWLVAATSIAWLDPHQPVRDANQLYTAGKYEEAAAAYNAALVDRPDSAELHFNLGDATYKQGKYDEAVTTFQKVETAGDPQRASRVAYNVGNATFRQGQALEQTEPQKALERYAEALASYRRALGLTPDDEDSKFNHELVTQRIAELKKRLEEQKQEQEQNQDQQQQGDQEQQQDQKQDQKQANDQQQPEQQQQGQENPEEQQQPQPPPGEEEEQQQAGGEPPDEPKPEAQPQDQGQPGEQENAQQEPGEQPPPNQEPSGDVFADEKKDGELSKGEAAAILDSQRGEEVSPEDIIKKLQGARVAEPAQDW